MTKISGIIARRGEHVTCSMSLDNGSDVERYNFTSSIAQIAFLNCANYLSQKLDIKEEVESP